MGPVVGTSEVTPGVIYIYIVMTTGDSSGSRSRNAGGF